MMKVRFLLLGFMMAIGMYAGASSMSYITAYSADKNPTEANLSWYSLYFLDLNAVKTATAGKVTSASDYNGYATWLQANFADNKAATIANAVFNPTTFTDAFYNDNDGEYRFYHEYKEFADRQDFLAVVFFENSSAQAFEVVTDNDWDLRVDDNPSYNKGTSGWIAGPDPIEYLTWDEETKSMVATNTTSYTVVTKDTATFEDKTWYVVTNTVELGKITVNGAAHLILCDGAELKVTGRDTLKPGINVASGKSLTIYGQASGTGALIAFGGSYEAGIGGGDMNACGNITINGGTITAIGNSGAGIGGGSEGNGGTVTINGGTVTAMSMFSAGIGAGQASSTHGVITFAEGVEFSIVAGDDEDSATATTVADYVANRSAKYVKIDSTAKPKVKDVGIIPGEDWTKFEVAYTLDNLEEGVDYKVLIEVTAGGVTKSITNGTDIAIGSFTNSVDTAQLFGGKVFDEKAKVKVSLGTWKEYKWTQLWKDGPYFAEYNVGATKPEEVGGTYTFDEAQGLVEFPIRVPTDDDISNLRFQYNQVKVTWDAAKNGATITGIGDYASNSIFLPAASDYWTLTAFSTGEKAYYFGVREDKGEGEYYVTRGSRSLTAELLVRAVVDPKDVDSVRMIFDPVSTAEKTVELLAPPVEYLDWNGTEFVTATNRTYDVVTANTTTLGDGWYIIDGTIERGRITVTGAAHLILCDGAKLKVTGGEQEAGINVPEGKSLTIYGQENGTGTLEAIGADGSAGVGGNFNGTCGTITINGGTIKATVGSLGAGIGGGFGCTSSATITINGGTIKAICGNFGAGIGGGATGKITVTFGEALKNSYVWAGESATACVGMTTADFAADTSAAYVELPVEVYTVTYDGNGAAGEMTDSIYAVGKEVSLKANTYGILGYTFDGWTDGETTYTDEQTGTNFVAKGETLSLTAKWTESTDPIVPEDYADITNMFTQVVYPVTITLKEDVELASGDKISVPEKVSLATDGGKFDISTIVPEFGTPTVVGEGFATGEGVTEESILALFKNTADDAKLVYDEDEGKVTLVGRGESEEYPWVLDTDATVTAWVDEKEGLVIGNGLPDEAYEVDLVTLTNSVAKYNYTPASPLNAKVKVVEKEGAFYKTPTFWIGESGSYETLGAALEAGETAVLPGYGVTYNANGALGTMTNGALAAGKDVELAENDFAAVGYKFVGWTDGTNTYTDGMEGKNFASVDGTLALTAQWEIDETKSTATLFANFTNMLATASTQSKTLPITVGFTSGVKLPEGTTSVEFPTGGGFSGIKYIGDAEGGSNLEFKDGTLYGSNLRGEVTVDALVLMRDSNGMLNKFYALSEGETEGSVVTNKVVMLLGDDGKAYFNDKSDDPDMLLEKILAAKPRPTSVKLYEVKGALVTFEAMGGIHKDGTESTTYLCLPDTGYVLPEDVKREGYKLAGWFDGWKSGSNEITNNQEIVNYAPQSLYAHWTSTAPTTSKEGELHLADVDEAGEPVKEIAEKEYAADATLTTVTTPIYLENIGQRAFVNCSAIKTLTLTATHDYATLKPTTLEIGQMAFAGCTAIEELIIGGKVKLGAGAFQNVATLKKIIFLGDEEIEYADYALYLAGTKNGTGELKVYMSKEFQTNNSGLIADFEKWNSAVKIIEKVDVKPVEGIGEISLDSSSIVPGKPLAFIVQTSSSGKPDVDEVDIEYSTDLTNWSKLTEGTVKTAYPDGTVMIEIVVPESPSAFFRAVVNEE